MVNKSYNQELDADSGNDNLYTKAITMGEDRKWEFVHVSGNYFRLRNKGYGTYAEAESGTDAYDCRMQ